MSELVGSAAPGHGDALPTAPLRLRQAREAAGLHIAALAAALKVPVKKLEALEAGRYHELPDLTFARALAASASRHLKVDPAAVLEQIPEVVRPVLGGTGQSINAPFKSGEEVSGMGAMAWLSRPVVWGVGLLLLAAVAVAVLPQGWVSRFEAGSAPESEPFATAPGVVIESVVPGVSDETPPLAATENTLTAPGAPAEASEALAPEAEPPVAADPAPAAGGSGLLSIRAVNESWIEVINGSGVQVVQRVLKPGETLDFSTAPPYSVVVGRADAVQVTVRGEPLDVMPYARNSVARFEVK
jgi:cytoskeleton protein RodZ